MKIIGRTIFLLFAFLKKHFQILRNFDSFFGGLFLQCVQFYFYTWIWSVIGGEVGQWSSRPDFGLFLSFLYLWFDVNVILTAVEKEQSMCFKNVFCYSVIDFIFFSFPLQQRPKVCECVWRERGGGGVLYIFQLCWWLYRKKGINIGKVKV